VLVVAGYPIIAEWVTRGRTAGKAALGLRVVRDDGGPIGFRQALVRGLAGLVLEKPGLLFPLTTLVGVATISGSAREKRIGDMMAGTVVRAERPAPQIIAPLPVWVPPPLQPWVLSLDLHRLDDRLALSTRQFVSRAHSMTPRAQVALGEELRRRVLAVTAPPPPIGTPTPALLVSVLVERRRRELAAPSAY
jgi:RDD family